MYVGRLRNLDSVLPAIRANRQHHQWRYLIWSVAQTFISMTLQCLSKFCFVSDRLRLTMGLPSSGKPCCLLITRPPSVYAYP